MNSLDECHGSLHPQARLGLELFNAGEFFEAHEALETAWRAESGPIRELYRGILQVAVVYLHITRENYEGAVKVHQRSRKWLDPWPETCRGVDLAGLRRSLAAVMDEVTRLGPERLAHFDRALFQPIRFTPQEERS